MKHSIYFLSLVVLAAAPACKTTAPMAVINARYMSEGNDVITVQSAGTGKDEAAALASAEKNAFNTLLFRGFPQSSQKTPLAGSNEKEVMAQHSAYFKEFYDGGRYLSFITSSQVTEGYDKQRQSLTVEVKINLRALRTDLEGQGVLRKLGY
jgi:hypothetical protein